jgi:SAM-dependent methyltransferase
MPPEFDPIARDYDATFSHSAVGRRLRARVWALLERWVLRGSVGLKNQISNPKVLELNCGTGEDALWLAQRGCQVLATDVSAAMVQVAQQKIEQAHLGEKARAQVCGFADVGQLADADFDLVFSNFGGLNCASPAELRQLGTLIFPKIKPGGQFVAVVMSRFCWQETGYFLLKNRPRTAFRRRSREAIQARLDDQNSVPTWYYAPAEFARFFPDFNLKTAQPIGFWLPPSYLNPFFEKRPRLLRALDFLEKNTAPAWLAPAADHFFIVLEKKSAR